MALLNDLLARVALGSLVTRHLWSATASPIYGPLARRACDWLGITSKTVEDGASADHKTAKPSHHINVFS
ncbi:hypothetical protein [Acidocella facilis]|uniref:hypothetical protein n=1 Tax=Acidocella facilis TaxID=525 RepID=UPI001F294EF6|nr:hypothetical protein [Acidocella facilis]